jgi:ketosteroid isomerase-like protein
MGRAMAVILCAGLLFGCGPKQLSVDDLAKEKTAVEAVVSNFWKAYEAKDAEAMNKFLPQSSAIMFFGTDSAEVIKTSNDWKTQMKNDMQLFDAFKAGEPRNVATEVTGDGMLASTICEIPVEMKMGGKRAHSLTRMAFTMKKENDQWHIVQGMVAFATNGQSSAELLAKMKTPKHKRR